MVDLEKDPIEEVQKELKSTAKGLGNNEAKMRLASYGYNEIAEKKRNILWKLLSYFWGPIPGMIEVAAIISAIVGDWNDFAIIFALLLLNALIGFFQEHQAANAVDALKKKLALKARVLRNESWVEIEARELVPGDVVGMRIGEIIPADVRLLSGFLSVDQAALTGESLPVSKEQGDLSYSGSVVQQGDAQGMVFATGEHSYFGKTAKLVATSKKVSHFQKAVLHIGKYLTMLSVALALLLIGVQLLRGDSFLMLLQFALILLVASIPVALPAVLSVTMAVGSMALAKMKAIVTRLESIEEMAGMDILCADKTGTLTQNRLVLSEPVLFAAKSADDLNLAASLACEPDAHDAIDRAILGESSPFEKHKQLQFVPFDPVRKRAEAQIQDESGTYWVAKGAPQVIQKLCTLSKEDENRSEETVETLGQKGLRTLGVAKSADGKKWELLGLLSLQDPPREDSAETIAEAGKYGISVKMVTGDHGAIAKEMARQLNMGTNIQSAEKLGSAEEIEKADGYSQVFPEHKHAIVKELQGRKHIVGMTGDGVNDAPALKQADTGIAVSGATDAARAAADVVLTSPGLSTIVHAVEEAREIFERMNSYSIYRITETIRIMFFVVAAILTFNFYPITAIMIILLAFFNDIPIMAIAYDRTWLDPMPVRWNMPRVLSVSTVLGLVGVIETFGILLVGEFLLKLNREQVQTFIFLKLAVAGHLTLFVARTNRFFLSPPYPAQILLWSTVGTKLLVTLLCAFGLGLLSPISWSTIGIVWGYCLAWVFVEDWCKLRVYHYLEKTGKHRRALRPKPRRES